MEQTWYMKYKGKTQKSTLKCKIWILQTGSSIWRFRHTSIGIRSVEIRRFYGRFIATVAFTTRLRQHTYIESRPRSRCNPEPETRTHSGASAITNYTVIHLIFYVWLWRETLVFILYNMHLECYKESKEYDMFKNDGMDLRISNWHTDPYITLMIPKTSDAVTPIFVWNNKKTSDCGLKFNRLKVMQYQIHRTFICA